jgi:peroxiredoxin
MRPLFLATGLAAVLAFGVAAQEPLVVGAVAPDFTLPGATRFGALRAPVRLSDFKGKTVVLAFFFKVRTRG